jgi:ArsR family transcriptional regulator
MSFVKEESKGERCICFGEIELMAPGEIADNVESVGGIESLIAKLPSDDEIEDMSNAHKALADPIRMKVLWSLSLCDLCPCVLKEILSLSDSKLSYHLNILEAAGHISSRKEKNWRIYTLEERGRSALGQ